MAECQESRTQRAEAHFAMNVLTNSIAGSKTAHRHASSRTHVTFEAPAKMVKFPTRRM